MGLCGILKNHFCLNSEIFTIFTHHFFIQRDLPEKRNLSGHATASTDKRCPRGEGTAGEEGSRREGRKAKKCGRR